MELLRAKKVKISKQHRCVGCCREFPKGTKMKFEVWADGGTAYNGYLCETCQAVIEENAYINGGWFEYSDGELIDYAIEYESRLAELKGGRDEN